MKRALCLSLLLAGCSMEPRYEKPALPVPPALPRGDAYLAQSEATLPSLSWRDVFRDARLQRLIDQALNNNRDLRIAAANIAAARARYRIQRAQRLPEVGASAGATVNGGGSQRSGQTGGTGGTGGGATGSGTTTRFSADIGINAFEIDLFGRLQSLTRAEQNRYFATEAAARATRLALIGDIADAWLSHAANASLLTLAQQTAASAERSVTLTRARYQGGIAPRSDLRQAEQILSSAQADIAELRTALAQDVNALQLLLGQPVDAALLPNAIEPAAATIAQVPAGLDSRILLRRPDIVQAEYELRAANAEIGAARAALFPSISLTGLIGFASNALTSLFTGGAFNWQGGANASYSIFRGGAGRANVALSQAQRDALLATYEKSVQTAFREVADGLAREGTIGEQLRATSVNVSASLDNYQLANARYRGGIEGFLNALDAQRSLYTAQRGLISLRQTAASNRITLYRALGGDKSISEPAIRE